MRVIDVREHSEHLLVDGLARGVEILGEAAILANPVVAGAGGDGSCGGTRGLGGEECLIVDSIRDPL